MAEYKTEIPCTVHGPDGSITTILQLTLDAPDMLTAMGVIQSWFSVCTRPVSVSLAGVPLPPPAQG